MLRIESWRNFALPKDIFDLSFMFVQAKWNFVLCLIYRYVGLNYMSLVKLESESMINK